MNSNYKRYMAMLMTWDILQRYKSNPAHITKISLEGGDITLDETIKVIADLGREYEEAPWGRDEEPIMKG